MLEEENKYYSNFQFFYDRSAEGRTSYSHSKMKPNQNRLYFVRSRNTILYIQLITAAFLHKLITVSSL